MTGSATHIAIEVRIATTVQYIMFLAIQTIWNGVPIRTLTLIAKPKHRDIFAVLKIHDSAMLA
jgi:hypothetical protein